MAVVLSGSTNDITIGGVSVATDTEVSSAITDAVTTAGIALKTIASGTATFTATTNSINLTGIGVGVEIGDVIQISGAIDAKNNSEFTIEVITDANNVIVNQAHANKGTTKNVAAQYGDTGVTVKLLAKWYNADSSLGRDWVDVTANRTIGTSYPNNTNRSIKVKFRAATTSSSGSNISLTINGNLIEATGQLSLGVSLVVGDVITKGSTYSLSGTNVSVVSIFELR